MPNGEYERTRRKSIKYFAVEIEINVDFETNTRRDEIDEIEDGATAVAAAVAV